MDINSSIFNLDNQRISPCSPSSSSIVDQDFTCAVCGDVSNGKHYGIFACNGCSGFFKRSVRRQSIYRCYSNTGFCPINKLNRNQCQACRWKKCLQMGMIKEAVQNERPSHRRIRNTFHSTLGDEMEKMMNVIDQHSNLSKQTPFISDLSSSSSVSSSINDQNQFNPDEMMNRISTRMLLMMIKWIRHLPTFSNLTTHDQAILLQECWAEFFFLSIIEDAETIEKTEPNFRYRLINIDDKFRHLFTLFNQCQPDSFEFTCLKFIILFRSDLSSLQSPKIIEYFQDQAQMTLSRYVNVHQPLQTTRFGKLLLLLPCLRSVASMSIEKLYFPQMIGKGRMSKYLLDLWKNQSMFIQKDFFDQPLF